jgi:hypothetical protein
MQSMTSDRSRGGDQALVIMFVAAPALVRGIYRIRVPETTGLETFGQGWRT